jgi:IPT/TIG domain
VPAGRDTGGTRVIVEGTGFGPAGTPVTVTIGGVPALEAEVLDDTHITFVTPALPPNTPVDVVVVVNNGPPETLPGAYLPLPVPAVGSPVDTDGDGITDETELRYGLDPTNPGDADDDPDHDGVPSNTEITVGTHPNAPYLRYFAEGINNTVFNTGIAIANASSATNEVLVTFFRQGQAPVRKSVTLTGKTRMMLNTATVAGMADAAFGVEIAGNEAVTADRTTFWDLGGREAHSERAVEASPTWYFAEGATTGRFSLFYLLTNPTSQPANATVTFLRQVGTPIVKQVVVPGFARVTIPVNTADPGLASADLGGVVTADRPIVAERSMYLSSPTKIWEAGTGGTGVTTPANRWFFGEGATGGFFDAWILLSNPGSTDSAVEVRYVADTGADVTKTHTVPAGRRITIRVVDEDPAMMNTSFATFVTSTNAVPVVAERAMWWRSTEGHWTAGHVGVGFTEGGTKWVTADGVAAADGSSDTYALVSNTESRSGLLKVTAVFGDGTAPVERMFAIGANQRFTIRGRQRFPEVVGKGYSFIIESIGASPVAIVVDHSTYWDMDGRFWAMGTTSPGSKIK